MTCLLCFIAGGVAVIGFIVAAYIWAPFRG